MTGFRHALGSLRSFASAATSLVKQVQVPIAQNRLESFHGIWLRDNCRCEQCFHPLAQQRLLDTAAIDLGIAPTWMQLEDRAGNKVEDNEDAANVRMVWPDGHESVFSREFLAQHSYFHAETLTRRRGHVGRKTWKRDDWTEGGFPRVEWKRIFSSEDKESKNELIELVEKLRTSGFVFIEGAPQTIEATSQLANQVGVTRKTIFGDVWDVTSNWQHKDTAYSPLEIKSHTDTTFFEHSAGFEMFHCLHFTGTGGESTLVDGFRAAEHIRDHHKEAFETLTKIPIRFQYLDLAAGYNFQNVTTPILLGQDGEIIEVRFNNTDRAPPCVSFKDMPAVYEAMNIFLKTVEDPSFQVRFTLQPGSPMIFDNRRLLHGRTEFVGSRRLCGAYWNRDDMMSFLRARDVIKPMEDW